MTTGPHRLHNDLIGGTGRAGYFSISANSCTSNDFGKFDYCHICVRFTPSSVPQLGATPNPLVFGGQPVGTQSGEQILTVSSTGSVHGDRQGLGGSS
jgi:hypothetical protein